jgi:hypothetical protein
MLICMSTAAMVTRTRPNFTFTHTHIACLVVNNVVFYNEGGMMITRDV